MARSFCTDLAIERGEPLAGTGALTQRHLFIRWPKGKWRRPRFGSADMDEALQAAMRDASGNGRYVGLVEGGDGPDLQLLSFPDMTTLTPPSQEAAAEAIRTWGDGDGFGGDRLPRPIILCCTDAKTDACCARYGFPLYKALAKVADGYGFDVLQCTHIGGCHFAPSVIVMPNRDRYGRLTPADVPAFLQTLAEGRYYLPAFKGRDGLNEAGQAAEIAAMTWAEANGFSQADVRLLDDALPDAARHAITAAVGTARLHIVLERAVFEVYGTCRLLEDGPGKPVPRWSVVAIAPALADHAVTAAR